ncbi:MULTISPECIES: hypothetical protein [unclassified Exiguobacterium]|uniref:hypothetical protein n=1 Tax=unclassified Exiguobacterium TaxID=2644629 RepID=UPI001BE87424|nr:MULTISPECIES: hypothetical protein [unclassified Exiguobacterium]
MKLNERFNHMYASGKRSTRLAIHVGLLITLSGALFYWNDHQWLAEITWFIILFPVTACIKLVFRMNVLLTFNKSVRYRRLVWYECAIGLGMIVLFTLLSMMILSREGYASGLLLACSLVLFGIVASSNLDRKLKQVDASHVTHRLYSRGKVGHFD